MILKSCVFESVDTFRALCSYCVILDREVFWGGGEMHFSVSTVVALSFRPDCDTGTVIAPLQKIRTCVNEPNKDYCQKVVISSFHS